MDSGHCSGYVFFRVLDAQSVLIPEFDKPSPESVVFENRVQPVCP